LLQVECCGEHCEPGPTRLSQSSVVLQAGVLLPEPPRTSSSSSNSSPCTRSPATVIAVLVCLNFVRRMPVFSICLTLRRMTLANINSPRLWASSARHGYCRSVRGRPFNCPHLLRVWRHDLARRRRWARYWLHSVEEWELL